MKKIIYSIFIIFLIGSCKNNTTHNENDKHEHSNSENRTTEEHSDHAQHSDAEEINITQQQFENSKMELGTLSEKDFSILVKTTGMIDVPPQSIEIISSFYGGYIKKSSLLIGDKVKKGQVLVTIENPEFVELQQNYLEIKEQLNYLKSEFERQKTLHEEQITSQKKFLKAESDYKSKLATLSGIRKKLKMLNINISSVESGNITSVITLYSSISGSISKVNVSKGTHISPADEIMEIINTDHIHIELKVFEKDAMKIKKDQHIKFKIPEVSDEYFDAEVYLVGQSIDMESRTIKVHGHLHHETKNNFSTGMFVEAAIETAHHKAISLPEQAIIKDGDHLVVLKLESQENNNFQFKSVEVEIGKEYQGFVEIISKNLKATDKVLIKGGYALVGSEGGGHSH